MTDDHDVSHESLGVELIDERNAVAVIEHPRFRVTFVDGTTHETFSMDGPLATVQAWVASNAAGRQHAIHVEVPLDSEPGSVLLARVDGDYWDA
jgi:hypothetical protein